MLSTEGDGFCDRHRDSRARNDGVKAALRSQHILLHLAAVEMEERHRRVVAAGGRWRGGDRVRRARSWSSHAASASGCEPISTQTSSTSSASAWITPSTLWAMAEASAVKKRVSKRRTRPGGVIARAIRNRLEGSGNRPASANGFHGPSSLDRLFDLAAEAEPGFLAGFADRGVRQRTRAGRA